MLQDRYVALQKVVQLALGNSLDSTSIQDVDWKDVLDIATKQGLLGIAFSGIEKLPLDSMPDKQIVLKNFGQVQYMRQVYLNYEKVLFQLSELLNKYGIRLLLVKGYGLSLNYPDSTLRPLGDMDIYPFYEDGSSAYAEVNQIMEKMKIKVDYSHHKHSVFHLGKVMVECHHSFLNTKAHKSSAEIENILKYCMNPIPYRSNVYFPSSRFNSLYLLRHSAEHFASVDLSLRVVLDWATFVQKNDVDWDWLLTQLNRVGMKEYLAVLNAICVRFFGYNANLFPELSVDDDLVERSLKDILHPEFSPEHESGLLNELFFRYKRWRANEWKHNMVFKESLWHSFVTQMWSHMLKPSL